MQRIAGFMRTYWDRGEPGRATPRSLQLLMMRFWLLALVFKIFGASWDVSWHFKWLRDDFAPPHILNTVGTGIAICLVLAHSFTGYGTDKRSLRIMQAGTFIFVLAGPIDVINHRVNGLDITSWSPSHMLLYLGTGIMIAGVIRNWFYHYPRAGEYRWQYTAGLTALWAIMFENTFFPNFQQEYGILSVRGWFAGNPDGEGELLEFAAAQIGREVDDIAVHSFALPIPAWVYPIWTVVVCGAMLIFARMMLGRRWTATAAASLYVIYRVLIWPALAWTIFPASVVPFWLIGVGIAVDLAFVLPMNPYIRAVVGAVIVTAGSYGSAALQTWISGTPLDLAKQSVADLRATFEAGLPLRMPPISWESAYGAVPLLAAVWVGVVIFARRTIGVDVPRPPELANPFAQEPLRSAHGVLEGFAPHTTDEDTIFNAQNG